MPNSQPPPNPTAGAPVLLSKEGGLSLPFKKLFFQTSSVSGFTLFEVLIALAILSVLSVILYATFRETFRSVEAMEVASEVDGQARLGFFHLTKDFASVYGDTKQPQGANPSSQNIEFQGNDDFHGDTLNIPNDTIQFTAITHRGDDIKSDRATLSYGVEGGALMRKVASVGDPELSYAVMDGVMGMNLRYLDRTTKTWENEWILTDKKSHPQAVEIEIILDDQTPKGRTYKTWVKIPD